MEVLQMVEHLYLQMAPVAEQVRRFILLEME